MTVGELIRALQGGIDRGDYTKETDILIDVLSDEHGCVRAEPHGSYEIQETHDEDGTPYVVLGATCIDDLAEESPDQGGEHG